MYINNYVHIDIVAHKSITNTVDFISVFIVFQSKSTKTEAMTKCSNNFYL